MSFNIAVFSRACPSCDIARAEGCITGRGEAIATRAHQRPQGVRQKVFRQVSSLKIDCDSEVVKLFPAACVWGLYLGFLGGGWGVVFFFFLSFKFYKYQGGLFWLGSNAILISELQDEYFYQ